VDAPRAIALSPDGQHLVVCDWQRGLVVLDRQTMKAVASADVPVFKVVHLDVRSAI